MHLRARHLRCLGSRARAAQDAAQAQTKAQALARAQGAAGAADAAAAAVGDTAADAAAAAGAAGALTVAEGAAAVASEPSQPASLFILGDTSYGSCCVDEVAAQHLDADIVVHYGRACLTPTTHLATIWVLGKERVDVGKCAAAFGDFYVEQMGGEKGKTGEGAAGAGGSGEGGKVLLLADCVYAHCLPALEAALLGRHPGMHLAVGSCEQLAPKRNPAHMQMVTSSSSSSSRASSGGCGGGGSGGCGRGSGA